MYMHNIQVQRQKPRPYLVLVCPCSHKMAMFGKYDKLCTFLHFYMEHTSNIKDCFGNLLQL